MSSRRTGPGFALSRVRGRWMATVWSGDGRVEVIEQRGSSAEVRRIAIQALERMTGEMKEMER